MIPGAYYQKELRQVSGKQRGSKWHEAHSTRNLQQNIACRYCLSDLFKLAFEELLDPRHHWRILFSIIYSTPFPEPWGSSPQPVYWL